jgi:hypothetical protein
VGSKERKGIKDYKEGGIQRKGIKDYSVNSRTNNIISISISREITKNTDLETRVW